MLNLFLSLHFNTIVVIDLFNIQNILPLLSETVRSILNRFTLVKPNLKNITDFELLQFKLCFDEIHRA